MMRALKWIAALVAVAVLAVALVFFGNFFSKNSSSVDNSGTTKTTRSSSSKKGVQVTGKADDSVYKTVIKDGKYLTNKTRGLTTQQNAGNTFNLVSFEDGLLKFSKNHFSTSKYVFQEGQYLSMKEAIRWLNRKAEGNPTGLNPEDNGKTDDSRVPIYLQTIEEQDFMTQDGDNLKLAGIVIGMGMNTQDVYQKEKDGPSFTQDIDKADRIAHGKEMAAEVVKRYRAMKDIPADVPIYVAMYAQAKDDSLAGGSFYSWNVSKSGDSLGSWTDLNNQTVVLPMQEGTTSSKSVASSLNTSFTNFVDKVQGFFPNLASVTGQAAYTDGTLRGLNVTVSTQFYSATEIQSFANYIAQIAPSYLPNGVPVQIRIEASTGMQAYVTTNAKDDKYTVMILGSY